MSAYSAIVAWATKRGMSDGDIQHTLQQFVDSECEWEAYDYNYLTEFKVSFPKLTVFISKSKFEEMKKVKQTEFSAWCLRNAIATEWWPVDKIINGCFTEYMALKRFKIFVGVERAFV